MKQELKDKEVILCAAIHYDNGLVYPHQFIYGIKTGFVLYWKLFDYFGLKTYVTYAENIVKSRKHSRIMFWEY